MQSTTTHLRVLSAGLALLIVAALNLVAAPAWALKYAAPEHDLEADPHISTWIPAHLTFEPRQEFHIIGSDTMDQITLSWVEMFRKAYPPLSVTMEARASASGYKGLIEERSQIATVAREMKPGEIEAFVKKFGYKPTRFRVATGSVGSLGKTAATVVLVDKDNPVKGLTLAQLDAIYSTTRKRGYKAVSTWGDLGLTGKWRRRPIHLYGLEPPNGIEQFFKMVVMEGGDYKHDIQFVHSGRIHAFNIAAMDMAKHPGGFTYAMLANLTPNVKALPIAEHAGGPYIYPTVDTVYHHTYPLSRYIYIFVNKAPGKPLDPTTKEFLRLVLSYQGQEAVAHEHVFEPLLPGVVQQELTRLNAM